jgi:muconolactone delta-isomerase
LDACKRQAARNHKRIKYLHELEAEVKRLNKYNVALMMADILKLKAERDTLRSQLAAVNKWRGLWAFTATGKPLFDVDAIAQLNNILSGSAACPGCKDKLDRIRYGDEIVAGLEGRLEMAREVWKDFKEIDGQPEPCDRCDSEDCAQFLRYSLALKLDTALTADATEKEDRK